MSEIKKYEKITATDVNALKTKVLEIYANRTYLNDMNLISLNDGVPGFGNTSIAIGNQINQNFYYAINALLQLHDINSEIIKNIQYDNIIVNHAPSGTDDLIALINDWETTDPKKTKPAASCRGGCVGFCYGCTETCSYACTASESSNRGNTGGVYEGRNYCTDGTCTGSCWKSCNGQCYKSCTQGCTGCENNCTGSCATGCNITCTGNVGPYEP